MITSISLDRALVARLDAVAQREERSRSWLTAAALKQFLDRHLAGEPLAQSTPSRAAGD